MESPRIRAHSSQRPATRSTKRTGMKTRPFVAGVQTADFSHSNEALNICLHEFGWVKEEKGTKRNSGDHSIMQSNDSSTLSPREASKRSARAEPVHLSKGGDEACNDADTTEAHGALYDSDSDEWMEHNLLLAADALDDIGYDEEVVISISDPIAPHLDAHGSKEGTAIVPALLLEQVPVKVQEEVPPPGPQIDDRPHQDPEEGTIFPLPSHEEVPVKPQEEAAAQGSPPSDIRGGRKRPHRSFNNINASPDPKRPKLSESDEAAATRTPRRRQPSRGQQKPQRQQQQQPRNQESQNAWLMSAGTVGEPSAEPHATIRASGENAADWANNRSELIQLAKRRPWLSLFLGPANRKEREVVATEVVRQVGLKRKPVVEFCEAEEELQAHPPQRELSLEATNGAIALCRDFYATGLMDPFIDSAKDARDPMYRIKALLWTLFIVACTTQLGASAWGARDMISESTILRPKARYSGSEMIRLISVIIRFMTQRDAQAAPLAALVGEEKG